MNDSVEDSGDAILRMLSTVYGETIDRDNHVDASEELDEANLEEAREAEEEAKKLERQEKSKRRRHAAQKTAKKTTMNPLIGKDLWELGKLKFAEKDTLAIGKEA